MFITEPEAAALYRATLCNETCLRERDRFLVCDASGGTVVAPILEHPIHLSDVFFVLGGG